jgi:DNA-binding NarL/FixJ family response regulator
MEWRR